MTHSIVAAYVRRAYARAARRAHAVADIPYGESGLAGAIGRAPTADEVDLAKRLTVSEGLRLQHAGELAGQLGICVSFDDSGRLFRCDQDGREIRVGYADVSNPGLVWPRAVGS